jgi:hypothetical protein
MLTKKPLGILIIMLVLGMLIGGTFGEILGLILPAGVVKEFFLKSISWGIEPRAIRLVVITLTIGFSFKINIISVLGILFAVYLFRWY